MNWESHFKKNSKVQSDFGIGTIVPHVVIPSFKVVSTKSKKALLISSGSGIAAGIAAYCLGASALVTMGASLGALVLLLSIEK